MRKCLDLDRLSTGNCHRNIDQRLSGGECEGAGVVENEQMEDRLTFNDPARRHINWRLGETKDFIKSLNRGCKIS